MRRVIPVVQAEPGLVVECAQTGFCGAVVGFEHGAVVLEDRHGKRRLFPLEPAGFLFEGQVATLVRPSVQHPNRGARQLTASGSLALPTERAKVAKDSRIWVEGLHDAALIEKIWGDDLRAEAIVVEPVHGADDLKSMVAEFGPAPSRRLGILLDHLVAGSKETRLAAAVSGEHVLIAGHPYVDVWQAVKPARLGLARWPVIGRGQPWKESVSTALGAGDDTARFWRRLLSQVDSYHDLETPLVNSVERLIDFVTRGEV